MCTPPEWIMGLLLSVLVACVGFVELLDFCYNVRRNLTRGNQLDLGQVRRHYVDSLSARDVAKVSPETVPRIRLNRDCLSHEDIEIEINKNVVQDRSRSSSQRRYLVTEKKEVVRSRSASPRRFVVSEEPQGLHRSQHQQSIPEFLFYEKDHRSPSPHKRIVLKGDESGRGSPLPLPQQFIVTEEVLSELQKHNPLYSKHEIEIHDDFYDSETEIAFPSNPSEMFVETQRDVRVFQSTSARTEQLLTAERNSPARSKSPSPIPRKCTEAFRRSPSPFPSFDLLAPRNSICTELLDNPPVSVSEVDEEMYSSKSPSPVRVIVTETEHNTTQFWTNQLLVTTPDKRRSRSKSPRDPGNSLELPKQSRHRSKSESDGRDENLENNIKKTSSQCQVSVEEKTSYNSKFLNELDGVKAKTSKKGKKKSSHNKQGTFVGWPIRGGITLIDL